MKALTTNLFFCAFALGTVATISPPAAARDRPGTPNEEKAYACGDSLNRLPAVCVEVNNTASEPVYFETEVTLDGEAVARGALGGDVECLNTTPGLSEEEKENYVRDPITGMYTLPPYSRRAASHRCEAYWSLTSLARSNSAIAKIKTAEFDRSINMGVTPQGIRIRNVQPLSKYCFRFRTRRVSDEVVSAQWSNWACAQARPLPAKPGVPTNVSATFLTWAWPGNTNVKPLPNRVVLRWGAAARAGYYTVYGKRYERGQPAYAEVEVNAALVAVGGESVEFCAHNISGRTCIRTLVSQTRESLKPRIGGGVDAIHAIESAAQGNLRPVTAPRVQVPGKNPASLPASPMQPLPVPTRTSEMLTPARGSLAASVFAGTPRPVATPNPATPGTTCKNGFVWREARPGDLACVTPDSRSRVAAEYGSALSRVQPGGGAYGPNTCRAGLVWREAFAGDLVCVSPQVRMLVRQENQLAATRVM